MASQRVFWCQDLKNAKRQKANLSKEHDMRVTNRPKKRKKNRLKKVPMEFLHVEGKESVPKKRIKFSLLLRALLYIGLFVIGTVGGFKSWDYFKNNLLARYGYQLRRIDVELIGSGRISKDEVIRASNVHV